MSDYAFAGKESGPAEKKDKAKFSDWLMGAGSLKKAASQGARGTASKAKRLGSTSYLKSRIADTKRNVGENASKMKAMRTSDMSYRGGASKASRQADRAQQVKQMGGNPRGNSKSFGRGSTSTPSKVSGAGRANVAPYKGRPGGQGPEPNPRGKSEAVGRAAGKTAPKKPSMAMRRKAAGQRMSKNPRKF